jgi:hypothetical protein
MVHDRPYKGALTHEQALAELKRNAGTQFDPQVVRHFSNVYADGVPPDGLEEVYRLHERARGGLRRIDPQAAAAVLSAQERPAELPPATQEEETGAGAPRPVRRRRSRNQVREAAG